MNKETIRKIAGIAEKNGLPHIAAAGKLEPIDDKRPGITEWFCPGTLENLNENLRLSAVVWDRLKDAGFQLPGEAEGIEDTSMMDGYTEIDGKSPLPQVERRMIVKIDSIIEFKKAPHSGKEKG